LAHGLREGNKIDFVGDVVAFQGRVEIGRPQVGLRCLSFVTASPPSAEVPPSAPSIYCPG
jgi:hypothetical protein